MGLSRSVLETSTTGSQLHVRLPHLSVIVQGYSNSLEDRAGFWAIRQFGWSGVWKRAGHRSDQARRYLQRKREGTSAHGTDDGGLPEVTHGTRIDRGLRSLSKQGKEGLAHVHDTVGFVHRPLLSVVRLPWSRAGGSPTDRWRHRIRCWRGRAWRHQRRKGLRCLRWCWSP
jgi:hypothetical protein